MLVVLASRYDVGAKALVSRWASDGAVLLTAGDLSVPGWLYRLGDVQGSTARIDGWSLRTANLSGVLVRLPVVTEEELPHIHPDERCYVAQEMTAFLLAWLSALQCPVLNRPDPPTLTSPLWPLERLVMLARRRGLDAQPVRRSVGPGLVRAPVSAPVTLGAAVPPQTVTVVGDRCYGCVDEVLAVTALRIARVVGADLLRLRLSYSAFGPELLLADPWVDISQPLIADATLGLFRDGCASSEASL